jgi:hypothetical protein
MIGRWLVRGVIGGCATFHLQFFEQFKLFNGMELMNDDSQVTEI